MIETRSGRQIRDAPTPLPVWAFALWPLAQRSRAITVRVDGHRAPSSLSAAFGRGERFTAKSPSSPGCKTSRITETSINGSFFCLAHLAYWRFLGFPAPATPKAVPRCARPVIIQPISRSRLNPRLQCKLVACAAAEPRRRHRGPSALGQRHSPSPST